MDPYRSAYETALVELAQITKRFEHLRTRKNHVEHLIVVLQQTLGAAEPAATETLASMEMAAAPVKHEAVPDPAEAQTDPDGYSFLQVPSPISDLEVANSLPESSADPFQRRMRTSFRFKGLSAQRLY
jgi:hypothetical protein